MPELLAHLRHQVAHLTTRLKQRDAELAANKTPERRAAMEKGRRSFAASIAKWQAMADELEQLMGTQPCP